MANVVAETLSKEFEMWLQSLEESTKKLSDALAESTDINTLTELYDDMKLDESQLEEFRPVVKKTYPYDFTRAIEILRQAKKLTVRAARVLKITPPSSPEPDRRVNTQAEFKLPKLDVPKFYGDHTKYPEFKEMFQHAIHSAKLTDIQKFTYLRSYVKGAAETQISGFPLTSAGYELARTFLDETYGDKKIQVQQLYEKLKAVPRASTSLKSIKITYDGLEPLLRMLQQLGEDVDTSVLLYHLVVKKYEPETLLPFKESISTVTALQKTIRGIVLFAQKLQPIATTQPDLPGTTTAALSTTAANKAASASSTGKARAPRANHKCPYCNKPGHWADECPEYKTTEERREKLKGACGICLRTNHAQRECRSSTTCAHCKEAHKHHRSLCPRKFGPAEKSTSTTHEKVAEPKKDATAATTLLTDKEQGTFLTLMAPVRNPETKAVKRCRIILDSCSSHSYILESTRAALDLPKNREDIFHITTFQGETSKMSTTETVFELLTNEGTPIKIQANTTPTIIDTVSTIDTTMFQQRYPEHRLEYADTGDGQEIQILVGSDYFCKMLTFKHVQVDDSVDLLETPFGWVVSGRIPKDNSTTPVMVGTAQSIERLWSLDQIGIATDSLNEEENERIALQQFYDSIEEHEGRNQVSWPWKQYPPNLPDNFGLALGRLRSLIRTYEKQKEILQRYDELLKEQERAGIIEEVEQVDTSNPIHYLPHHPIISNEKTTRLRSVFDASARTSKKNKSLNDCIYKGKLLLLHIVKVLLRIRMKLIVLFADVEKAFHQIQLQLKDRDVLRFLWLIDIAKPFSLENIKIYRFCRTPFGVIASLFLLLATIYYHFMTKNPKYLRIVQKELYSDNLTTGANTVKEAVEIYTELKAEFNRMSMNLRNWATNHRDVQAQIPEDDQEKAPVINILGIRWDSEVDTLAIKPVQIGDKATKRSILSAINSVFDPLGIVTPVLLPAKLLLKNITDAKHEWDQVLPQLIVDQWFIIKEELAKTNSVQIPRYVPSNSTSSLHCFVDASILAFGVAVYLRTENEETTSHLIFAKSRVTPNRSLTIPKLELIAVVLGIRCLKFIIDALDMADTIEKYVWSDSKCVLAWIETSKTLPIFVTRRLEEIQTLSATKFRYVPTTDNTADLATRGTSMAMLRASTWFHGPLWLTEKEENWPSQPLLKLDIPIDISQETEAPVLLIETFTYTPFGIDPKKYSSLSKLMNITVLCIRAIPKLLAKFSNGRIQRRLPAPIYAFAERLWIKTVQLRWYREELDSIRAQKPSPTSANLNLYIDSHGILRSAGRFQNAPLCYSSRNPILLPPKQAGNHFVELLILHTHVSNFHAGVQHTLAAIRRKYWIPSGRRAVHETLRKACRQCVRFNTQPFKDAAIASLPEARFQAMELPFTNIGIDIFGPLHARTFVNKAPVIEQRYGLIITCIVTRAIHIEILESITTNEIILALRRCIARRTTPKYIISDNAKQFILCEKVFHSITAAELKTPTSPLATYLTTAQIEWKFIPNYAPWRGGIYERLIALIKDALKRSFRNILLSNRMLCTVATEIEAMINARPITYISADQDIKILRPSDFLQQRFPPSLQPPTENESASTTHRSIISKWRKSEQLLTELWQIWEKQYLRSLRERQDLIRSKKSTNRQPKCGEIVLLALPHIKRNDWQLAEIVKLIPSHDNIIRTVEVRFPSGRLAHYATNRIAPFELHVDDTAEEVPVVPQIADPQPSTSTGGPTVPTRRSTVVNELEDDFEIDEVEILEIEEHSASDFELDTIEETEIDDEG